VSCPHGGAWTILAVMPTLLIVHHTPSPSLQSLLEAVVDGAGTDAIGDVEVEVRAALTCPEVDALQADGYLLGTTANLGYMSGALKHFFDRIYYPCLEETRRRPFGAYVHGNSDTAGAVTSIETATTGLGWRRVAEILEVVGEPAREDLESAWELGATVAAAISDEVDL
jgi:hypothetical protein